MDDPTTIRDKNFNAEKRRLIAEALLRSYALFLDRPPSPSFPTRDDVAARLVTLERPAAARPSARHGEVSALTRSDDATLARIVRSLVSTCDDLDELRGRIEGSFEAFLSYGTDVERKGGRCLRVAEAVRGLLEAQGSARRAREITAATLRQVCALLGKRAAAQNQTALFPDVLHPLGDLWICLMILDHLLDSKILRDHWRLYRNSIKTLMRSTSVDARRLKSFDSILARLEIELLPCDVLKNVLRGSLDDPSLYAQVKNCGLSAEICAFVSDLSARIERDDDSYERRDWFKLNLYVAFHDRAFGTLDRKLLRRVYEINKRLSACSLIGNLMWYPERFLMKHTGLRVDEKAAQTHRIGIAQRASGGGYAREVMSMCAQTRECLVGLGRLCGGDTGKVRARYLEEARDLLVRVLRLGRRLRGSIDFVLNLHADNDLPMGKSVLLSVCKSVEALKCIEISFDRVSIRATHLILLIKQHLQFRALSTLSAIRKTFTSATSYTSGRLDSLSALTVCERALRRLDDAPAHALLVAALSLSAGDLGAAASTEMRSAIARLRVFERFGDELGTVTDCSMLSWHARYALPVYLGAVSEGRGDVRRYGLVAGAMGEGRGTDGSALDRILGDALYGPLAQLIESRLRLQTHQHLHLPAADPFANYYPLNFRKYPPVPLGGAYKSVRDDVEHRLSGTFYDLTSVVLYDWRSYGEMRRLAEVEYGLRMVDDDLPMQTLEQGLDVLEVMRNIDVFVERYLYNLNSQVFFEKNTATKHLNSIGITQVANSIRTHGTGIMNTTVNFTYQFLRDQLQTFSQFIFDEQIKSRLLQDRKIFQQLKNDLSQMYPYRRAEKFNVGIRKLGLRDGESYLDLFRGVVTRIGNAMGYVRLIRSGGRRCLAEGASFVPDLEKIDDIAGIAELETSMPELSKQFTSQLVHDLRSITANIDESTEYFKLLVDVFVPELRSKQHRHLKIFHMIVPPLTVNYIEHMLHSKERMSKRNSSSYTFTDDGFALGLAYVIEVLDQGDDLEALHWFRSVEKKLDDDRKEIEGQMKADSNDDKLKQALELSMRKVQALEREFRLLYYGFNSARLFFQQVA